MAHFFINRPIFAWVLAIILMLAGIWAIKVMPVSQYPTLAPPVISINAYYPGASARTAEDTITQVIEQQMNGLDNLMYIASQSDSSGKVTTNLTFQPGTNSDIAQMQVQNKLSLAIPSLPQVVQQQGVSVAKASTGFLLLIGFCSPENSMNRFDLADYVVSHIQDPIRRLPGVGNVTVFGSQYAMRIWLDPYKLTAFGLTTADVKNAILAQNAQIASGQLGETPALAGQVLNATIVSQTLLRTPEEFRRILLRTDASGAQIQLKDVARVELGGESYQHISQFNGKPAIGLAIQLATGANALDTAEQVRAKMAQLKAFLPADMTVVYPYDTTPFIKISIQEVIKTLGEAIILVFFVMYLFLQNIRATLIPTIAVPVVLLGTFAFMALAGFSINTLTMFGLVLAIGLLVDDAIVVVENVERVMREQHLSAREATHTSMRQITGALIGIALVLSAVFIPMAFFGGSSGAIYRQFSLTIVVAMVLSVLVALILTPALCAAILKPVMDNPYTDTKGFFAWFNRKFDSTLNAYEGAVTRVLRRLLKAMIAYGAICLMMVYLFFRLPTAFLPEEDQGILFTQIQAPAGATQAYTAAIMKQVEQYYLTQEKSTVESIFSVTGFSFSGQAQNMGMAFIKLKDWKERSSASKKASAIAARATGFFSTIKGALIFAFAPPPIAELGNATGWDLQLQDRAGLGHAKLLEARNQFLEMAARSKILTAVRPNGQEDTPHFKLDIDLEKANMLGVSAQNINDLMATAWGSAYVNNFIDQGRIKKVYVQADTPYRMLPTDLDKWYVKSVTGDMVPFSAFSTGRWIYESPRLERYNGFSAREILGQTVRGKSSGEAMAEVEAIAKRLPHGIGFEWTGISFQEKQSGDLAPLLYTISIVVVFLCLAALYESWSIPFTVLLVIPLGIIGALCATGMRGLANDIYFQIGLLTTVGLSAKNAILIVEFAKSLQEQGHSLTEAILHAAKMRLRPILMTSLAFVLGVLPLALSNGAGSGSQQAIGTGVLGGMISATVGAIFFVPVFFILIRKAFSYKTVTNITEKRI